MYDIIGLYKSKRFLYEKGDVMITDLKKEIYEQIFSVMEQYKLLSEENIKLEEELKNLEDSINKLDNFFSTYKRPPRPDINYNIFQKVFLSKKRKESDLNKYLEETKEYRENNQKRSNISLRITEIKNQIAENKRNQEKIDLTQLNEQKLKLDQMTEDEWISLIVSFKPELRNDLNFIKEIVDIDPKFLKFDGTNNVELYISTLNKILSDFNLMEKLDQLDPNRDAKSCIDKIIKELENPKQVDTDKYKIPTKYLLEAIRTDLAKENCFVSSTFYIITDGNVLKETGQLIESSFESKDDYILIHKFMKTNHGGVEDIKLAESVCQKGLRTSFQQGGPSAVNCLHRTTYGSFQNDIIFTDIIAATDQTYMVLKIPKERIDNNTMIWGSKNAEITSDDPSYVLPEYVAGYVFQGKFYPNPYSLEEREQYNYFYGDQELIPQNLDQLRQ